MDLVFVLDSSSSVGMYNWNVQIGFVFNVLDDFKVSQNDVRVGAFRYNSEIDTVSKFDLADSTSKGQLLRNLQNIPYNGRCTRTGAALVYAVENMFTLEAGNRPDVPDVLVLITDGRSQDNVQEAVEFISPNDIQMYAVGIGLKRRGRETIKAIAGEKSFVIPRGYSSSIAGSEKIARMIGEDLCAEPRILSMPPCVPAIPDPPINGNVTCNGDNNAKCEFACDENFRMLGSPNMECVNGEWTVQPGQPIVLCEPIPKLCSPYHEMISNGDVACTMENRFRSECTFRCNDDYRLDGEQTVTCIEGHEPGTYVWDYDTPTCAAKLCTPHPEEIDNGRVTCTLDNKLGSVCSFQCDTFFKLEGKKQISCVEGAEPGTYVWDYEAPTCPPIKCQDLGTLDNGRIECTNDNYASATCNFICEENHSLYPPTETSSYCGVDGLHHVAKPCCVNQTWAMENPCPPLPSIDLVAVIDSSSSVKSENWGKQMQFVKNMLGEFDVGLNKARIGVFRYNKIVDRTTEIKLNESVDVATLMERIDSIPYDGSGTRTGNALDYALNNALSEESGNRPDVLDIVLVVTDGKSQDDVKEVSKNIRMSGADVFAVGVGLNEKGYQTILDIAGPGREDHAYNVQGGFDALDSVVQHISAYLEDIVCNPCHRLESML